MKTSNADPNRLSNEPTSMIATLARNVHEALDNEILEPSAAWALSRFSDYLATELRVRGTSTADALAGRI